MSALCINCGNRREDEPEDPADIRCNACHFAVERAVADEAAAEFRWLSRDWLKCHGCSGTGERHDAHCFCRKGQALAREAEAAFAFVRDLPAGAVFNARYMAENDINPQERIAK